MGSTRETKRLHVEGMTCVNCQKKIEKKLRHTDGVLDAKVSYRRGTADVTYDTARVSLKDLSVLIARLGYRVIDKDRQQVPDLKRVLVALIIIVALFVLLQQFGILNLLVPSQLADTGMGYGMLFVIGLLTSVHCIAMCGGINLSQSIPLGDAPQKRLSTFYPTLLYNAGRVVSYTAIGFVLGLIGLLAGGGSEVGLPALLQGILKLVAGVFMVIMGINLLGLFPGLRRLIPTLRVPQAFARRADAQETESASDRVLGKGSGNGKAKGKGKSPLLVGLLNGLMPCGPLQSMQIVALATGNPLVGAGAMLLFSLGTVPLMLGLGSFVAALGRRFTQRVMNVGAVLVVVLGLAMLSQGFNLTGFVSPSLLLTAIIALSFVGVVSALPYRQSSQRIVITTLTLVLVVTAFSTSNLWTTALGGDANRTPSASDTQIIEGKQVVRSTLAPGRYPSITVEAGVPVRWVIDAPEGSINGCNNRLLINEYGVEHRFKTGENIIEFTPANTGVFQVSCWMGMINSSISVLP